MNQENNLTFDKLGLDPRLEKSIKKVGWSKPTLIQEKAIIFGLEKKDLLIKGRTGCGKTGAFLIPILHNLLEFKKNDSISGIRVLILNPSKELCRQTSKICKELNYFSSKSISIFDFSEHDQNTKKVFLSTPDIFISTPNQFIHYYKENNINIEDTLLYLAIDEADLMFSFGYKEDMCLILKYLPKNNCQTFLASASLNTDIVNLKELFLNNPVIIKLKEDDTNEKVIHYYIYLEEIDKFVLLNALFKFKLMTGRTIIFVNNVNRCYKMKIFLQLFGIKAILLNSEMPLTSRCHSIDQFNRGIYDIIIASDEKCVVNPEQTKKSKFKKDKEFTVSRGIDFQNVNNVINFDFPESQVSYIHRVGRTGRGPHEDVEGIVLSLISVNEKKLFTECQKKLNQTSFKKFKIQINELESIKYRIKDAYNMITKLAVNEARVKEIKNELLNSQKLKSYFHQNLKDFKALKQEKTIHIVKPVPHLKNIPDYIVPDSLQSLVKSDISNKRWYEEEKSNYYVQPNVVKKKRSNPKKQMSNPLKTFKISKNK